MAEEVVRNRSVDGDNISPNEDEIDDSSRERDSQKQSTGKRKKSKSKYDQLDEKWNTKFGNLNNKLDSMFDFMKSEMLKQKGTANGDNNNSVNEQRPSQRRDQSPARLSSDEEPDLPLEDDNISLQPGQGEVLGSDEDTKSDEEEHLSEKAKKCLFDIFGEDAIAKKSEKKTGITLDKSQKEVLLGHWRAEKPNTITAFAEETKELFPVDEETEKFLQVPSLDELVGRCLVKRHGNKASFSKGKNLFSQPYKMLEKIAYRGQQASFLGIIINMYIQQGLGNLIEVLTADKPNLDKAIQQVRDIFAMSTKELDQVGRAGAFHHILRRQMCMTDTSLFQMEDSRDISDLPLTGDGVFGEKLESSLKSRKEKNKTLDDLLPDLFPKSDRKRKGNFSDSGTKAKKGCPDKDKSDTTTKDQPESFRIPKISGNNFTKRFDKKPSADGAKQTKPDGGYKKSSFPTRGGKTNRK